MEIKSEIWLALVGVKALEGNEYISTGHEAYVNIAAVADDEPDFVARLQHVFEERKFEILEIEDIDTEDTLTVDNVETSEKISLIIQINQGENFVWGVFNVFNKDNDIPIKATITNRSIVEKLQHHKLSKNGIRLSREVAPGQTEPSEGYILALSGQLVLVHQTDDFKFNGYQAIPLDQIKAIKYKQSQKYFDKIMRWEKEIDKLGMPYAIDLNNWASLFRSLQDRAVNVIVECEANDIATFTIGTIEKVGRKYVYINHFDAEGYLDESATPIDYPSITKVTFENQYVNTFSKYTRHRKP